ADDGHATGAARRDLQARLRGLLEIHARAEGLVAGGRQDGDLQVRIGLEALETLADPLPHGGAERIAPLRPVDGDDGDAATRLVEYCLFHASLNRISE